MERSVGSWRSALFVPGSDDAKLTHALESDAHLVIVDWEDSVPAAVKDTARRRTRDSLRGAPRPDSPSRAVRINASGRTLQNDLEALRDIRLDAVVLPKATPETIAALPADLPPLVAIIETACGLRDVAEVAEAPGVECLALGAIDLGVELRLEPRRDGLEILFARSQLVLASVCAGIRAPFDCVHPARDDLAGLAEDIALARSLGMRGKLCIHPAQLGPVNEGFRPAPWEVDRAQEVVAAYTEAVGAGRGAVLVRGEMVDRPVFDRARLILDEAIERGDELG